MRLSLSWAETAAQASSVCNNSWGTLGRDIASAALEIYGKKRRHDHSIGEWRVVRGI